MADAVKEQKNTNWVFTYRHINHVAKPGEYATEDDFRDAVIGKFRKKDGEKRAEAPAPTPVVEDDGLPYRVVKAPGLGWWNVLDAEGKVMNEKGLRKPDADALSEKLLQELTKVA